VLGVVFGPLEELQDHIAALIEKAKASEDKTMTDAMIVSEYPTHIVTAMVLAMHYATEDRAPITEAHVFDAILVLDKLDTMNCRVVSK